MPFPIGQASMKIYLPNKKLFFPQMTGQDFPKPGMLTILTCMIMLKGVFTDSCFMKRKKPASGLMHLLLTGNSIMILVNF